MTAESSPGRTRQQMAADRARLMTFLKERCFISGTFRLASGKTSNVYFDCKRATLDPEGLSLVSDLMLDKVEELCGQVEGSQGHLVRLYQQLLPKIPQKRGDRPSNYCIEMYERGIERFREAGLLPLTQAYEAKLAMLKAAKPG